MLPCNVQHSNFLGLLSGSHLNNQYVPMSRGKQVFVFKMWLNFLSSTMRATLSTFRGGHLLAIRMMKSSLMTR